MMIRLRGALTLFLAVKSDPILEAVGARCRLTQGLRNEPRVSSIKGFLLRINHRCAAPLHTQRSLRGKLSLCKELWDILPRVSRTRAVKEQLRELFCSSRTEACFHWSESPVRSSSFNPDQTRSDRGVQLHVLPSAHNEHCAPRFVCQVVKKQTNKYPKSQTHGAQ